MLTTYKVGNLSLQDSTRAKDFLLTEPDDSVKRSTNFKFPKDLFTESFIVPDDHTTFSCNDDDIESYTKHQMQLKLNMVKSNVKTYTDHVIPDHIVAVVE